MDGWSQLYANIGSRYNLGYLALKDGTISAKEIAEFRSYVEARPGIRVYDIKLLGRVMSVYIVAEQSAPMVRLVSEFVHVGGTSTATAIPFQLKTVTPLIATAPTTAQQTATATGSDYQKKPGLLDYLLNPTLLPSWQLGNEVGEQGLENLAAKTGQVVSNLVTPLLVPALLLGGMYLYATGRIK